MNKTSLQDLPVPLPSDWNDIYNNLQRLREERGDQSIPRPPVPLILAGAAFSTPSAIRHRWRELIEWVVFHGFIEEFKAMIPPAPKEDVADRIAGYSDDDSDLQHCE